MLASGCSVDLRISLTVIKPRRVKSSSMTKTFAGGAWHQLLGILRRWRPPDRDEALPRVMMADRLVEVGFETQIPVGDDPDHLAPDPGREGRKSGAGG